MSAPSEHDAIAEDPEGAAAGSRGFSLMAWLQLCRAANVFTAMADIFAGFLLVRPNFAGVPPFPFGLTDVTSFPERLAWGTSFLLLLGASSGLYVAGMVFNDVFDRYVDARERPGRPIPSGRVSVRSACVLGMLLVGAGLSFAGLAGGPSLMVALLLAGAVFAYDGGLKATPIGPVAMGLCRGLNVLLGASTLTVPPGHSSYAAAFGLPQLHVALAMTVYIAGVTWFARQEAGQSRRGPLALAAVVANLGIALLMAYVLHAPDAAGKSLYAAILLGVIAFSIDRRIANAVLSPSPLHVQMAIRTMLLSLVMLDCAIVYFSQSDPLPAAVVALLIVPSLALARFLAVT